MVSLKKELQNPQVREYTPVHLIDEEEAVRKYCPQQSDISNSIEISVNRVGENLPTVVNNQDNSSKNRLFLGLDKQDWLELIFKALVVAIILALTVFLFAGLFGDSIQLLKIINNY